MKLNDEERAMHAGELGPTKQWAIDHQIKVGKFFDAEEMVPVSQAHMMADAESFGHAGVTFVEEIAGTPPAGPPEHKTRRRTLGTRQCPGTPRTQNEEENLGRQAASRNAHQINDNVRSFEAEETFTAHRHRGEPPEPKTRRRICGTGQCSRTPEPKMRRFLAGAQCIGG